MARSQDPDSAGSQFFIVTADSTFLDRQYTVFGEVTEGMDVADKIVNLDRDENDCPLEKTNDSCYCGINESRKISTSFDNFITNFCCSHKHMLKQILLVKLIKNQFKFQLMNNEGNVEHITSHSKFLQIKIKS